MNYSWFILNGSATQKIYAACEDSMKNKSKFVVAVALSVSDAENFFMLLFQKCSFSLLLNTTREFVREKHEIHFTWLSPSPPLCLHCVIHVCASYIAFVHSWLFRTALNYSMKVEESGKFFSLCFDSSFVACKSKTKRNSFDGSLKARRVFPRTQLRIHVLSCLLFFRINDRQNSRVN